MSEAIETALEWYSEMIRSESAGGVILALSTLAIFIVIIIAVVYYSATAFRLAFEKAHAWFVTNK